MDSTFKWLIPLHSIPSDKISLVGNKAYNLSRLASSGFCTAGGFSITTEAYEQFIAANNILNIIKFELGRKPLDTMRWEEIWDAALRIRSAFMSGNLPSVLETMIEYLIDHYGDQRPLVVRSSAPSEDSTGGSFAGLHETILDVVGKERLNEAIKTVWASLWSDAAILYRKELKPDPTKSAMAIIIQPIVRQDVSGVMFGRNPVKPKEEQAVVESVPGLCKDLVDGNVNPDRWILKRKTGDIIQWRKGDRGKDQDSPLLKQSDLRLLMKTLLALEEFFKWTPDVEWTGRKERLTLLQARPVTNLKTNDDADDPRAWYLTLKPGEKKLRKLSDRVSNVLIPELKDLGQKFAEENLENYNDSTLALAIEERLSEFEKWTKIYWYEFIPFAHETRALAIYYNDTVKPDDPYEFVGLLEGEQLCSSARNELLLRLASQLLAKISLFEEIQKAIGKKEKKPLLNLQFLKEFEGGQEFLNDFDRLRESLFIDVIYEKSRLSEDAYGSLKLIAEIAASEDIRHKSVSESEGEISPRKVLENRLFKAVGKNRYDEAREVIKIARLSWKLRDDDNLLLSRVESQLIRALQFAVERLKARRQIEKLDFIDVSIASQVAQALGDRNIKNITSSKMKKDIDQTKEGKCALSPRQIVGQPAAPGLRTGKARVIAKSDDLSSFQQGEVLVCDAIQPMMTHIVLLASAVIERRGGMLIHGAIIARELV